MNVAAAALRACADHLPHGFELRCASQGPQFANLVLAELWQRVSPAAAFCALSVLRDRVCIEPEKSVPGALLISTGVLALHGRVEAIGILADEVRADGIVTVSGPVMARKIQAPCIKSTGSVRADTVHCTRIEADTAQIKRLHATTFIARVAAIDTLAATEVKVLDLRVRTGKSSAIISDRVEVIDSLESSAIQTHTLAHRGARLQFQTHAIGKVVELQLDESVTKV